jgi:hypothetical protein
LVEEIIDLHCCGHSWQFLVQWVSYGPQHDLWIASSKLSDCKALNHWYELGGDGLDAR